MPPVGLEPTNPSGEGPQTYALDRAATGTGKQVTNKLIPLKFLRQARYPPHVMQPEGSSACS